MMKWLKNISTENSWTTILKDGKQVIWKDFQVGPLTLSNEQHQQLCQKLLQFSFEELAVKAAELLSSTTTDIEKSLILHSTTADLGAFQGDLSKVIANQQPKNYAAYTESRAVFLGKQGDLTVGRIQSWIENAQFLGIDTAIIDNCDYYYLSDALLQAAVVHQEKPVKAICQMVDFLQKNPKAVVRLYVLDKPMQIFLIWLQQLAGLNKIYIDANSPEIGEIWNTKNILYPTVKAAQALTIPKDLAVEQCLQLEQQQSKLYSNLQVSLPTLPGYVVARKKSSLLAFTHQLLLAAQFLQARYGLSTGCLKAANAGDGARITPNIDLENVNYLQELAVEAYQYGDDYVLESHMYYQKILIGKEVVTLAPSAHIRMAQVAEGMTLQFTKGTSWTGNIFLQQTLAKKLGIEEKHYTLIRQVLANFLQACTKKKAGLTIGGIDFAIGKIGGKFGEDILLAAQDPNISFNGAEFLRVFLQKTSQQTGIAIHQLFAATWVFVPIKSCTHQTILDKLSAFQTTNIYTTLIAVVPNFWGMIGVASTDYELLSKEVSNLKQHFKHLIKSE